MKSLYPIILFAFSVGLSDTVLANKKLPVCDNSSNCLSSQAKIADKQHYIAPLEIKGDPEKAWQEFKQAVANQGRMVITHQNNDSVHAIATSFLLRYIDDINGVLDSDAQLIHIRSASRVSHKEFGANRKRLEALRETLQKAGVIE